ncbi:helix-turn-helix domain-containing protein [Robbsia sp. KACC 23696]|uniref:helix-turn-helix domain-containing protein n=1 Tax=Robbsia sp. KACC 23696 TaxID=3149231 RepID=UPI00325C0A77
MLLHKPLDAVIQDRLEDETIRRKFSIRLDMTLKRKKLSSTHIARQLGVAVQHLQFWRAGVTVPTIRQVRRLSTLLDVPMDWLCAVV